jgi:glycosyltransferase involved in cell wall biosynthesis
MSVIVICEGLGGTGAVANVAWQQALGLSLWQPVCLICDGLSPERRLQLASNQGQLQIRQLRVPGFAPLRRFSHLPRQLLWILLALRATQKEMQAACTTVICHSHPVAAAVAWRFGGRIRLIMVSHGDIFHRPPGSYDPAISWLYRCTTPYAHRHAAMSVALSPVMAERIQAHGVRPERIALIPNGLDPAEIGLRDASPTPAEHWLQRPLRLLFVGRLDPVKGVEVLLKALAVARQTGLKLQLDLVGGVTITDQRRLETLTQQLGLDQTVSWRGPQPRSSLAEHYRHCHVVVVPSLDDPLPTVVLEAMACGRPVLGSAVGGIGYLVRNGESGLLVPPGDPAALAEALGRLERDRYATDALGEAALERSRHFTWPANVSALQALILDPAP